MKHSSDIFFHAQSMCCSNRSFLKVKMLHCFIFVLTCSQVFSVPLEPGQPGGPWTSEEIDIVRDKVIGMMDCTSSASENFGHPDCWTVEGLPDKLDEGDLDLYARDHDEYLGPREYGYNGNNIRYKWRRRGPNHSRLIQLAFHDCLRYVSHVEHT